MPSPLSDPSVSHTSSQQWQSFEIKMRHRRAERCVLRAQAALEAGMEGMEEEARAALDEARALNPHAPTLESLRTTVREQQIAASAAVRRTRHRRMATAAALIAVLAGGAMWLRDSNPAGITSASASPTPAVKADETPGVGAPPPARAEDTPAAQGSTPKLIELAPEPVRTIESSTEVVRTSGLDARPPDATLPTVDPPTPPPAALPAVGQVDPQLQVRGSTTESTAAATSPPPRDAIDRLVNDMPVAALPAPRPPAPAVTLAPAPAAPPAPSEEPRVRAVLAQFESAYSNLDASAAQQVWPSVDERSLARAFGSLQSQRVSLGRCAIALAGATARADCSGRATWTPKVGGGTRTEPRHWRFELLAGNGTWQIVRAEAR